MLPGKILFYRICHKPLIFIHRGTLKLTLRRKKIILQKIIFTIFIISTMKVLIVSLLVCAMMALTTAAAVQEAEPGQKIEPLVQEGKSHIVKRSSSCPRGWTRYNGRCFLYIPKAMTWSNAEVIRMIFDSLLLRDVCVDLHSWLFGVFF
ncbi:hypothetical protein EPR50_G00194890 [Perca flavescens]|uniref:Uncharacterized protein n=1 Tax=Perca flavescens TaxID=8167 RepID=A0A484CBS2_PERFV|nr:hypothetical protein EPR50_G00194890 [Perca flavescens]